MSEPDVAGLDIDPREFDRDGLHVARPGTIRTWTGRRVDPLDLRPSDVCIEDVAHALARLCRYNGHVDGFLSVARHSLWVSQHLEPLGRSMAYFGLLHDAAETYLSDLPRPVKQAAEMAVFRDADARADQAIAAAFGLPFPLPEAVHEADRWVLHNAELRDARVTYKGDYALDEAEFLERYEALR